MEVPSRILTFLAKNSRKPLVAKAGPVIAKAPIGAVVLAQFEIAILPGEALKTLALAIIAVSISVAIIQAPFFLAVLPVILIITYALPEFVIALSVKGAVPFAVHH